MSTSVTMPKEGKMRVTGERSAEEDIWNWGGSRRL